MTLKATRESSPRCRSDTDKRLMNCPGCRAMVRESFTEEVLDLERYKFREKPLKQRDRYRPLREEHT